jgi:hypothetical protein
MKLKTFEAFSMHRDRCDRCKLPTQGITIQSMFNDDVICNSCHQDEKSDPEYRKAELKDLIEHYQKLINGTNDTTRKEYYRNGQLKFIQELEELNKQ